MRPLGRRLALDTAYLLTGLPAGVLTFTVVVTGWSLAAGLLITLLGLPVAYATVLLGRAMGRMERLRAGLVLGAPVGERYRALEGGFLARLKAMALDAQTWKDVVWHLLLLGLGIAGFTIAVTGWGTALGLLAMPAWWWALPASDPVDLGLLHVDDWGSAVLASAIGLVALPVAAALVRGSAAGTAALARLLLGPGRAELEQRVEHLATTRAGAVDAASAELERLERDLHDGAQARLVAVAMELGMAAEQLDADPAQARERVTAAREETGRALGELRDLARGMRPGLLAERGLGEAVRSLAARSAVPATVRVDAGERRPPATVESAAYFVVAEALANAAKHAGATRVTVDVARHGDRREVLVADDGRGGAVAAGRGLDGLRKRVEALDGTLTVTSPAGAGTHVRAELPCGS
ncbi:MAG TPA: sensor domain-containing protein [Solirubrobacteraceae bacterium]|nr:sensor domain-containing protein [Solirubrobacteraceae bacterium]